MEWPHWIWMIALPIITSPLVYLIGRLFQRARDAADAAASHTYVDRQPCAMGVAGRASRILRAPGDLLAGAGVGGFAHLQRRDHLPEVRRHQPPALPRHPGARGDGVRLFRPVHRPRGRPGEVPRPPQRDDRRHARAGVRRRTFSTCGSGSRPRLLPPTCWWRITPIDRPAWKRESSISCRTRWGRCSCCIGIGLVFSQTGTLNLGELRSLIAGGSIAAASPARRRRPVLRRVRREDRHRAHAHVASGRAFAGAQRDQRDAVRRGDRDGPRGAPAGPFRGGERLRRLGHAPPGVRRGEHAGGKPAGPPPDPGKASPRLLQPQPRRLHAPGPWFRHLIRAGGRRAGRRFPPAHPRGNEGARVPRRGRPPVRPASFPR